MGDIQGPVMCQPLSAYEQRRGGLDRRASSLFDSITGALALAKQNSTSTFHGGLHKESHCAGGFVFSCRLRRLCSFPFSPSLSLPLSDRCLCHLSLPFVFCVCYAFVLCPRCSCRLRFPSYLILHLDLPSCFVNPCMARRCCLGDTLHFGIRNVV